MDNVAPSYRMTGAARRIASNIELAMSEAISQREEFVVAYDLDSNTYWVINPVYEVTINNAGLSTVWAELAIAVAVIALLAFVVAASTKRLRSKLAAT